MFAVLDGPRVHILTRKEYDITETMEFEVLPWL